MIVLSLSTGVSDLKDFPYIINTVFSDGRTNEQENGRTDRQANGRVNGRTDSRANGQIGW